MTYDQAINYLYDQLPMFSRIGAAAYKKDLGNIISLCTILDNPQHTFKSIHIAGTNGKGSVSHMLAAVLQSAGYKTGLHTSPHLYDFRERMKINGQLAEKKFVTDFVTRMMPHIENIQPSFFELSVAMAFYLFAQEKVDIAVIETGLGGRLDSTNILQPVLSIITNIGMDHTQFLGNTLPEIAKEKAGIIKKKIPVVIGEHNPITDPVFTQVAAQLEAPIYFADKNFSCTDWKWKSHELQIEVARQHRQDRHLYHLDLMGLYQTKNILTVLQASEILHSMGWNTSEPELQNALQQVKKATGLHGRWEVLDTHPLTVMDVAHNAEGMRQVMKQVEISTFTKLHVVLGLAKDKDASEIFSLLPSTAQFYFSMAQIPRAMDAVILQEQAAAAGLQGDSYRNVNEALKAARLNAGADDMILVCGSIFLIAEVER